MDCPYICNEEGKRLSFNFSYKQTFFHEPKRNHGMPEYLVISEFMREEECVRQVGLEILLYLRRFVFASRDMIVSMLQLKKLDYPDLDELLDRWVGKYFVNYFTISQYNLGEIPEDAFKVYCLDSGAIPILTHFSTTDSISWFTTDSVRSIELVTKYLATGLFYQRLAEAKGDSMTSYMPLFDATIGRRSTRFSAWFTIMNGFTPINFLLDTVRFYDLPGPWMKKVSDQLATFSKDRYWQKYFDFEPIYLFLCEDQNQGLQAAKIFYRMTGNQNFRIITDEVLTTGFVESQLLQYEPSEDRLILESNSFLTKP